MPGTDDDVFDEIFNEDETKILTESDAAAAEPTVTVEETGDKAAPVETMPAPAADAAAATDQAAADKERDEFLARHADKTPAELAELLFQQQKRANQASFSARTSQKAIDDMRAAAKKALEERQAGLAEAKKKFDETLEADPDAAARMLAERNFAAEERTIEDQRARIEQEARFDQAVTFAGQFIPELEQVAPAMQSFAVEMGYTPEEAQSIDDGRTLVMLYLAQTAGKLMKSGVIDLRGNVVSATPVSETVTDPRLKAPAAPTSAGSGGGQPAAPTSIDKQAAALLQMSEDDFSKLSQADLEKIFGG